jgi:hypothetical protein
MVKFKALPRGTQLVLIAGPLLIISLFFTWQNVEIDFGPAGIATVPLDGFDMWGLLIALLTMTLIVLVALAQLTDVDMSEDVPWETVRLTLGAAVLAIAVVKSLTDSGSTWESYGFVAFAGAVALGTYLDWARARRAERPLLARKRRGISSAV